MSDPCIIHHKWRREFVGSMDEVIATARWLADITAQQTMDGDVEFAAQLCLEEILTNIVCHSGKTDPHVSVQVDVTDNQLQLTIEDDGRPFDITSSSARPIGRDLESVEPGGLGLHLIRHYANRLDYSRASGRNRVIVAFQPVAKQTGQPLPG